MKTALKACFALFLLSPLASQSAGTESDKVMVLMRQGEVARDCSLYSKIVGEGKIVYAEGPFDYINLFSLNKEQLRILRNAVYARHGYVFDSPDLSAFFSKFEWYAPKLKEVDALLTRNDKMNIANIKAIENAPTGARPLGLAELVGVWHVDPGMPSGWAERFMFYADGRVMFGYPQMAQLAEIWSLSGRYSISGGSLRLSFMEKLVSVHGKDYEFSGAFGYAWKHETAKTVKLEKSLEIVLPMGDEERVVFGDGEFTRKAMRIGGIRFYKCDDDPGRGLR